MGAPAGSRNIQRTRQGDVRPARVGMRDLRARLHIHDVPRNQFRTPELGIPDSITALASRTTRADREADQLRDSTCSISRISSRSCARPGRWEPSGQGGYPVRGDQRRQPAPPRQPADPDSGRQGATRATGTCKRQGYAADAPSPSLLDAVGVHGNLADSTGQLEHLSCAYLMVLVAGART